MGQFHDMRLPGEDDAYRAARDELLAAEIDLRRRVEAVAALRRGLPAGGEVKEDYVFVEGDPATETRFSELFADGKDSLAVYSFMFAPDAEAACPMCTAFLDSLNGAAPHIGQRLNLAVVAKAPIGRLRDWAAARGWTNLRLLSSGNNSYNRDYFGETPDGEQTGMMNVFHRTGDLIRHTYTSEMLFAPAEPGQNPRHIDQVWPLWNLFDLTPEGRGTDWFPKLDYG